MGNLSERHYFIVMGVGLVAAVVVAALWFGFRGDDAKPTDEATARATDVCSRAGSEGNLAGCEEAASTARVHCATLTGDDRRRCEASVDELLAAAREAVFLAHGECDKMTSDAARAACRSVAAVGSTPTPPATPARTPTPTATPRATDTPRPTPTIEPTETPRAVVAAATASPTLVATQPLQPPVTRTPVPQPTTAAAAPAGDFSGRWRIVDTVTEGASAGQTFSFDVVLAQSGPSLQGGNSEITLTGTVEGNTATVQFTQPGQGYTGTFNWTLQTASSGGGSFSTSVPNRGTSLLLRAQ